MRFFHFYRNAFHQSTNFFERLLEIGTVHRVSIFHLCIRKCGLGFANLCPRGSKLGLQNSQIRRVRS